MLARTLVAAMALSWLPACIHVNEMVPPEHRLAGTSTEAPEAVDRPPFVGIELEEELSGSLDDLAFLPGLTVVSIATGSPADRAGIRRGDRLITVNGVTLEQMDQWGAILAAHTVGDTLQLEVERAGGQSEVDVVIAAGGRAHLPTPVRHIEHWKARVVAESVAVPTANGSLEIATQVVRLLADSPLEEAGIQPGTRLVHWNGEPITGAGDLVTRIAAAGYGDDVTLGVQNGDSAEDVEMELWSPPRHVAEASVPILFGYTRDVEADEVRFTFLDLWILSLFDYHREGSARAWSILRFFRFETGAGELVEVKEGATAGADS